MHATPPALRFGACMQQESSCTTSTPAINAPSTSAPCVIIVNAFCTQVMSPPFLNLLPLADAITTGLTGFEFITGGDCPKAARAAPPRVTPPATLDCTKRRLFMLHPITGCG